MSAPANALPGNALPWVRLWRVEHETTGHGPFHSNWMRPSGAPAQVWGPYHRPYDMPSVTLDASWVHKVDHDSNDSWHPFGDHSRFAFANGLAVSRWIDGRSAIDAVAKGYVMRVLAVPQEAHIRSRHQAIYDARRARVLRTWSLLELPVPLYGALQG